jgi:hypothetical protein
MKYQTILIPTFLSFVIALSGCASAPEIVKVSGDTYKLTRTDKGGSLGDVASTKTNMMREADAFASSQGKSVVPIAMKEEPLAVQGFTALEYQFQIADKNSIPVQAAIMTKRSDGKRSADSTSNIRVQDQQERSKDLYTELIKLDELRNRGILTEDEFTSQKKKILNSN